METIIYQVEFNDGKIFRIFCGNATQKTKTKKKILPGKGFTPKPNINLKSEIREVKMHKKYPKQDNEHNALDDAKWNKELHNFLK